MEYEFPSFSILLTFLVFVFMTLKSWKKSKNLPPGPWKLPLIGNMHQLVGSLPHRCLANLAKKYGPLMHIQLGELSLFVISSPETAKEVMKIHDINFAERPHFLGGELITYDYTDIAFAPYGDYWRQLRKITSLELLSSKRTKSFRSIREEEVSNVIRSIASNAGSPINFTQILFALTNDITARATLGGKCKEKQAFILNTRKAGELASGFSLAAMYPSIKLLEVLSGMRAEAQRLRQEADKLLDNIINEHKACKANGVEKDLVHVLLEIQDQGNLELPLTNDSIKAVVQDVFAAGTEMSSSTLEWALAEMLKHPRVLEKAQAEVRKVFDRKGYVDETDLHELEYLKLVMKETFRLRPVLPLLLPRECREICQINGYDIPIGSKIIVNAWAIGRDPNNWTNPESFYPERFLGSSIDYKGAHFELIPFGSGRRICPGITFSMANIELPLANFLYHFDWKLPNGLKNEDLDMAENFGAAVKRKGDLHLIPIPYHPPPLSK
ncbi:hypothetical protein ACOSQ4_030542 [Xanthoceras sorbifolium]